MNFNVKIIAIKEYFYFKTTIFCNVLQKNFKKFSANRIILFYLALCHLTK